MPSLLLFLASFTLFAAACSDAGSDGGDGESGLRVVATTTQIGDFARNVGGDRIDLDVLLSPNQDAHDFELEPSQIRAVAEADLILRNGLGLDAFLDKALESTDATVATLSEGVQAQAGGHAHEEHEGEEDHALDPHIWFSVDNAHRMVENLRDALIEADPEGADAYRANATAYLQELETLDAGIHAQVATVPQQCRKIVTTHGVLGYYATAYGFEMAATVVPGTSSEAQASVNDVADAVALIRQEGVPAIFAEASTNPDLARQVAREAGVQVVDALYGDSLGPSGSDGATYIGMMRSNTDKIVGALKTCDAPQP